MKRERSTAPALALSALVLPLLLLGVYVTGYFWLGERKEWRLSEPIPEARGKRYVVGRIYEKEWQATIFEPAASVEAWLTGFYVSTETPTY
jgi:hypothetical protein